MNYNNKKIVSKGGMLWFDVEVRFLAVRVEFMRMCIGERSSMHISF